MKLRHFLMTASVAALLSGAATAQDTTADTGTMQNDTGVAGTTDADAGAAAPAPEFTSLEEMTVGDMLGMSVTSPDGESIGEIDYVVQDANGASAVIGIGGFLGLGEYTVALPLGDFDYDAEQRVLTLGTDKETLKSQPEFDESGAESLPEETPLATLMESDPEAGSDGAAGDSGMTEQGAAAGESTGEGDAAAGSETDDEAMADDGAVEDGSMSDSGTAEGEGATTAEGASAGAATADTGTNAKGAAEEAGGSAEEEAPAEGNADEELEENRSSDG